MVYVVATMFPCKSDRPGGCGGGYTAEVPASPYDWTEDDWARFTEAQHEHISAHPDSLKTQGGPDPRPKRDWVGCRCRGTCHCRTRRAR